MADLQVSTASPIYQCKSCKGEFPEDSFYASNPSTCKECIKEGVRKNRAEKADYYRAYDRKRYRESDQRKQASRKSANSPAGLRSRAKHQARVRAEEPEKVKARNKVNNALRDGKIERGTECHFCASQKNLQAHHEDYDHPLDVVWLCASCHGKLHAIKGDFRRYRSQL